MPIGFGGMIRSSRISMLELRSLLISGPCTSILVVLLRIYDKYNNDKKLHFQSRGQRI